MDHSNNPDWSGEFKTLLSSPLGKELISELTNLKQRIQDDAAKADTAETAFGLLREAGGVIKAIEHLQFLSAVLPRRGEQRQLKKVAQFAPLPSGQDINNLVVPKGTRREDGHHNPCGRR